MLLTVSIHSLISSAITVPTKPLNLYVSILYELRV